MESVFLFLGRRRPVGLRAAVLLLVSSLACGGGGEEADGGIGEIDFVDQPTATPLPVSGRQQDAIGNFLQETALLLPDMEYLDSQVFYLEELQEVARDIASHIESGQVGDAGLDWVIGVHRTVLEWDALQSVLAEQEVGAEQRERYGEIYVGMVESFYRIAFAVERLLGAVVALGPTGRTVAELELEEERRFRILLNQAAYFAEIADRKVSEVRSGVDAESFEIGSR